MNAPFAVGAPRQSLTAVAWTADEAFNLVQASISAPGADEVLVRIHGVGICHSDLVGLAGHLPIALPAVLGHEGAGVVEAVGSDVKDVVPGDRVVLTFRSCGECARCAVDEPSYCSRFVELNLLGRRADGTCAIHANGRELAGNFFGQSSFADYALAYERNLVKVPDDAPLALLGPLGCGVQTGAGSVMRVFRCPAGSSILIVGAGAVGLSALLGAVVQGCGTIIVSEPDAARRALAIELGATHVVDPQVEDVIAAVHAITEGVDYALDTSGVPAAIEKAAVACRAQGMLGLLGIPPDPYAPIPYSIMMLINRGLSIRGIVEGDSDPKRFIPELIELHRAGRFPFDRFVKTYRLEEINQAVTDQKSGHCVKAVLLTSAADRD